MEKITSIVQLTEAIRLLEIKQKEEEFLLKEQFKATYESIKPANLIKNTIKDLMVSPDLKTNLLSTVLSIVTGYASKKIVVGESKSSIKQLLGTLLQMGVTKLISTKAHTVLSSIGNVIKQASQAKNETTK
jgi:PleD family two-component response regulator